jgi:hypothetical protein
VTRRLRKALDLRASELLSEAEEQEAEAGLTSRLMYALSGGRPGWRLVCMLSGMQLRVRLMHAACAVRWGSQRESRLPARFAESRDESVQMAGQLSQAKAERRKAEAAARQLRGELETLQVLTAAASVHCIFCSSCLQLPISRPGSLHEPHQATCHRHRHAHPINRCRCLGALLWCRRCAQNQTALPGC